jgi:hypothetical protein
MHTSAYVSIRQHTSAYVSIRQHTSDVCYATCLTTRTPESPMLARMLAYAMLTHATRMLTYAMLTYADVCYATCLTTRTPESPMLAPFRIVYPASEFVSTVTTVAVVEPTDLPVFSAPNAYSSASAGSTTLQVLQVLTCVFSVFSTSMSSTFSICSHTFSAHFSVFNVLRNEFVCLQVLMSMTR